MQPGRASASLLPSGVQVQRHGPLTPTEVMELRAAAAWGVDTAEVWQECLDSALCTVTARDPQGALVGMGQVVGNARHAQLVDIVVHPQFRRRGVGTAIVQELLAYVNESGTPYVSLAWDKSMGEWLHQMYRSMGFVDIDFAMWLARSLKSG